ncbi:deaminase domain-containing protein [Peribacillus sp. TH14]|uniref:deaminase domain-containing protein n=1 Tax=Peribacillus sp. TH14 TaxID=2798481 RepID=UPI001913510A|nr:deaminase domain-containing protein [Peribacillus sp. TH14]MBK5502236.1 hypothetical protein [Peribacillus sp. TH14]
MEINQYDNNDKIINDIIDDYNKRLLDLIENPDIQNKDKYYYEIAKKAGNFACAYYYETSGSVRKYIAYSGFNHSKKFKYLKFFEDKYTIGYRPELIGRKNIFNTKTYDNDCTKHSEKWDRWDDSESKILEQVAFENNKVFKNNIVLWTRRYPCPSLQVRY